MPESTLASSAIGQKGSRAGPSGFSPWQAASLAQVFEARGAGSNPEKLPARCFTHVDIAVGAAAFLSLAMEVEAAASSVLLGPLGPGRGSDKLRGRGRHLAPLKFPYAS